VVEKHKALTAAIDALVEGLVGENYDEKVVRVNTLLNRIKELKDVLAQNDIPDWLSPLQSELQYFISGSRKTPTLMNHLIRHSAQIRSHQWSFEESSSNAFDFDSIFDHYKSKSRLPELFDEIVKILEDIKNSGEVDSVSMMNALSKVIATLKQSKTGSFFSMNSTWSFLISFLKNYMWGELSKVPVLGTALDALEKTLKETNEEMSKIHSDVGAALEADVGSQIKELSGKGSFGFVTYDKTGIQLPAPDRAASVREYS